MTNEELVAQIQEGNTAALVPLWEAVKGLVAWKARPILFALEGKRGVTLDDFMQEGYLAVVEAVETFDPEAGTFSAWLMVYLKKRFWELLGFRTERKRNDPINTTSSLDAPIGEDDGDIWLEIVPDPAGESALLNVEEQLWREQLRDMVAMVMEDLPDQQREVLHRRYWLNQSSEEIGGGMGISVNQTRNEEGKAIRRLRRWDHAKHLRPFVDFSFYTGTGLGAFRHTGSSIQERYLIAQENRARPEET